jgi:hypothetical protein
MKSNVRKKAANGLRVHLNRDVQRWRNGSDGRRVKQILTITTRAKRSSKGDFAASTARKTLLNTGILSPKHRRECPSRSNVNAMK